MVTKLTIALVEMEKMEKMGKIGKMAIKMREVSTAGIAIGVRIAAATTMPAMDSITADSIAVAASATP
jgi:hypothetical protein